MVGEARWGDGLEGMGHRASGCVGEGIPGTVRGERGRGRVGRPSSRGGAGLWI